MINLSHVAGYEYKESIGDGATGESVYVHPVKNQSNTITCTLIASAGTGKFQVTTSPKADIESDTATWHDWALGDKTGTVPPEGIKYPVTAIRGVSVSGAITIEIVI